MADIFISYSRKDSDQAKALAERLRAAGADVWMDTAALAGAETWSAEIVSAINSSRIVIILLSPTAVASRNVNKEVALASEKHKTIIPIVLERCQLSEAMEYALAGLQHVKIWDEEALQRTFAKLDIDASGLAQQVPSPTMQPESPAPKRKRRLLLWVILACLGIGAASYFLLNKKHSPSTTQLKTIVVLPFESLSTDKENDFFADGMTATLIDMLTSMPDLRVIDRRTSMDYKSTKLETKQIAAALESRYVVTGTVQRQQDKIVINVQLTDAETATALFNRSYSGKTDALLDLQKQIAENIAVELELAFNPNDTLVFSSESRSRNPQANELCMKAGYDEDHGKIDTAIADYIHAARLDTAFGFPYLMIARLYGNLAMLPHPSLTRDLILADSFLAIGKRLDTAQRHYHQVASWIASVKGDYDRAIAEATAEIKLHPGESDGYDNLALTYLITKQYALAAQNLTEELKRDPASNHARFLLMVALWCAHDTVALRRSATQAIPIFEASLTRRPDNKDVRNNSIPLALVWSGRGDEACKRMEELIKTQGVDSSYILNTAAINALCGKLDRAMELMRQEVARTGVTKIDFERPFFDNIRNFPQFKAWVKQKEALMKNHG